MEMDMLLRELWNDSEVSIPPLLKLVLFTGLNVISVLLQLAQIIFRS